MKILFTEKAWDDYLWLSENNDQLHKKANTLIKDIQRTPFAGLGKPEFLKGPLQGHLSRRLNAEHRIVYQVKDQIITFISFRFHYDNL
ncbi:MAG: Txe/YoeB family addiction module toxin [Candidatus Kapabacteria bacterium]|nr:Txe/YoeB family addiction module toxin [Candidatus Kapabacteria bacterium]